jgi:peroxiredoxin Q/BCP
LDFTMATAIRPGDHAPDLELKDSEGQPFRLRDLRGRTVVLYFYPRSFTEGCTAQACRLRDAYGGFAADSVEVIGVSVDDVETQQRFREAHSLPFPVLSDPDGATARAYGVEIQADDSDAVVMARRVTFIIDPAGIVSNVIDPVHPGSHDREVTESLRSGSARQCPDGAAGG